MSAPPRPAALDFGAVSGALARHDGLRGLLVAYSGGADSHAMLHLLAAHRRDLAPLTLGAVHVDHGLQPQSGAWARHCIAVCQALDVPCRVLSVDARHRPGESPEAAAREARYRALADLLAPGDALLTAHHRDDQAETLLLQLLRGAGPRGLGAMPSAAPLGQGLLLRPLLEVTRRALRAYARAQALEWVEDVSNADRRGPRNYLRHEILPRLQARWPAVTETLARSAGLCAESATVLDELAGADLERCRGGAANRLNTAALAALGEVRARHALRRWFRELGLPGPTAVQIERIVVEVLGARADAMPLVRWPGAEVRRHRSEIHALPPLAPVSSGLDLDPGPLRCGSWVEVPGCGRVGFAATLGQGLDRARLRGRALRIRLAVPGARFHPQGREHSQRLKKLLQEVRMPPWERRRLPLLHVDGALAAVPGLAIAAGWGPGPGQPGVVLHWEPPWDAALARTRGESPAGAPAW